MKAYFTASVVGKRHHEANYRKIIDALKTKGIDVRNEHIMEATEESIRIKTKEERLAFLKKLEGWITECDFVVAETTFPSISVGYEIAMAIARSKPILILYSEGVPPSLLVAYQEDKIVCEKYTSATLPEIIDLFVNFVRGASDIRFTFFITPAIATYLEKIAQKDKLPKAVYLRKLIEKDMHQPKHSQSPKSP